MICQLSKEDKGPKGGKQAVKCQPGASNAMNLSTGATLFFSDWPEVVKRRGRSVWDKPLGRSFRGRGETAELGFWNKW